MNKYRDNDQRNVVVDGVRGLLDLASKHRSSHLSMETLCLIFDSYVDLVRPVKEPKEHQ